MLSFRQVINIKLSYFTFFFRTKSLKSMCILHTQHIAAGTHSTSNAQSLHVLVIPVLDSAGLGGYTPNYSHRSLLKRMRNRGPGSMNEDFLFSETLFSVFFEFFTPSMHVFILTL